MTKQHVVQRLLSGRGGRLRDSGSAFAPANIALVKYWGKRDEALNLPVTSSLSVSLGTLGTHTSVRLNQRPSDAYWLNSRRVPAGSDTALRLRTYLDLFRPPGCSFEVRTRNTIPTAAGLASSASAFAALALALDRLFGWRLDPTQLSVLARLGSGSACRSLFEGFAEWRAGRRADGMDSHAVPLKERWPELRLGLLMVSARKKSISSRAAMKRTVETSPLYSAWPAAVRRDLRALRKAIGARDFPTFGKIAESNALSMHATMHAARPPVNYWLPASVEAMEQVWALRAEGGEVYFTMDAGPNLKLLFEDREAAAIRAAFPKLRVVAPFASAPERSRR